MLFRSEGLALATGSSEAIHKLGNDYLELLLGLLQDPASPPTPPASSGSVGLHEDPRQSELIP